MSSQTNIAPDLRFPSFEQEWETKQLGNLCSTLKSGSGITSSEISDVGDFPVYGGNGLRGYTDSYTHEGFFFLIGRQGALCGNINRVRNQSFISEHAIAVQGNEETDTEWLAQRLDYFNLNRLSESSAQPGLSVGKLARLKITVPSLPEQQKIADFLTAVDKRIDQLAQKKALLEYYKKGVMQQLFTQTNRFKDINGNEFPDWEEKKLGEVCRVKKGVQLNKEQLEDFGLYPAINGGVSPSGFTDKFNANANTITISEGGNSCGFVNYVRTNFWSGGHCYTLEDLGSSILSDFLFQVLKYDQRKIMALRVGSGLPNIQKKDINDLPVILPKVDEQTKIAHFLSAIDRKIESVATQITETQTFKRGLLQQMFV